MSPGLTRKLNSNLFSILYSLIPMRGSKVRGNNLGEGLGCRGDVQRLPGRCARVAGEMCKGAKVKSTPSPRPGVL